MEQSLQSTLMLVALPLVAVVCLGLNVFIRARGKRSFKMSLRAFGVEVMIESSNPGNEDVR